jgi:FkbM family methyltransferase
LKLARFGLAGALVWPVRRLGGRVAVRLGDVGIELDLRQREEARVFLGRYDAETFALYDRLLRPGDTALDVGANIGFHTAYMAQLAGPAGCVHAFEPNPALAGRFAYIAGSVADGRVRFHAAAVGDRPGRATLHVADLSGLSSIRPDWMPQRVVDSVEVECTTLDEFAARAAVEHIRLLKIDVEGLEAAVFRGAAGLLKRRAADFIVFECHRPATRGREHDLVDALEALKSCGYTLHEFYNRKGRPTNMLAAAPGCAPA